MAALRPLARKERTGAEKRERFSLTCYLSPACGTKLGGAPVSGRFRPLPPLLLLRQLLISVSASAFCRPELREGIDGYARTNAPRRPRRIRRVGAACCVGREVRGVYSVLMRLAPLGGCRSPSLFLTSSGRFSSLLPVEMQKDVCRIVSDRDLFVLYKYFVY
jgi:hypothetical protein